MLALAFALITSTHAGWFSDRCQTLLDHLVAWDPYMYEMAHDEFVLNEINRLEIKVRWHRATKDDLAHLAILRNERTRRIAIDSIIHPNERPNE